MRGAKSELAVLVSGWWLLLGCGHDQRSLGDANGGGSTAGDGDEASGGAVAGGGGEASGGSLSTGGSGATPSEELSLGRQSHIPLPWPRRAGSSCGVELGGSVFAVAALSDELFVTRMPFLSDDDRDVPWDVTDSLDTSEVNLDGCIARAAGDRFFVLWEGSQQGSNVLPEFVTGGFAVDREGHVLEQDLGDAGDFWLGSDTTSAAGSVGALGLMGRQSGSSNEIYFRRYVDGALAPSPSEPVASCQNTDAKITLVPTATGFAAALLCLDAAGASPAPDLLVAVIVGESIEVQKLPLPTQRLDVSVALASEADGSLLVAYGPAAEGEPAQTAELVRFYPTSEFGYEGSFGAVPGHEALGRVEMENSGLEFVSPVEGGRVLLTRGERHGEDRPPEGFVNYCFLDDAVTPTGVCGTSIGTNIHPIPSGLLTLDRHEYAPLVSYSTWDAFESLSERVLFDAGNDIPRALHCSGGNCEIVMGSFSLSPGDGGYAGISFLDVESVFELDADRYVPLSLGYPFVRTAATRFSGAGRIFREPSRFPQAWAGGPVKAVGLLGFVGPLLLSYDRGSIEVESDGPGLENFREALFPSGDGYRGFGGDSEGSRTGFRFPTDVIVSAPVTGVSEWGDIRQCGSRYLNFVAGTELTVSTNDEASNFQPLLGEGVSVTAVLGCTDRFVAIWLSNDPSPLQLVSLSTGEKTPLVTPVPLQRPAASVVGDRLALFSPTFREVLVTLVSESGTEEQVALPLPSSVANEPSDGWGDQPLVVPQFIDDDLSHISLIWEAESSFAFLSSWELIRATN